jgi:hypothetical protein
MKQTGCKHENSVIRAMRTGEWIDELRVHAAECPDCGEALRVAEVLRQEAGRLERVCAPPDTHWVLRRSRRVAREIAMRRMGRVLAAARGLAAVYAIVAVAWLLRGVAAPQYHEVASSMHGVTAGFAMLGAMGAAVCMAAGIWPILGEDGKRSRIR